ncbi:hypothetical protein KL929_004806 [Ogataea haglerorum]|nr:hypothetical protein KL913_004621 [Ogataea haglerorum]KAG7715023.1 hypothetical protein KL949_004416 [Ogataea haglerorum]KAG7755135.1 hypothetical protein KL947_004629 [Ogataea haglerorum]KAG7784588.1 hypothetical protein KL945_004226 [Ogataea haglerorum]KAG7785007.1 hypothetical protein KL910_004841 [Ogataea haglerorum]
MPRIPRATGRRSRAYKPRDPPLNYMSEKLSTQEVQVSTVNSGPKWKSWLFSKEDHREITKKYADETLDLMDQHDAEVAEISPEQEKKLVRKLWLTVLPLVCLVNATLFVDKNAISYASLTGVFQDMSLTKQDYNNIQTYFYVGYLLGQFPSHLAFQKLPISRYVTFVTATWCLLSLCTLGCKSYGGLSALRFFLGFFESGITPCVEHTIAMFFTVEEQAIVNPIFWVSCIGVDIPCGFISYGLQHTTVWRPWKWYWLFVGLLSALVSVACFFVYPDNPATARFFTVEERVHIVRRVKRSSRSSIEQKTFKTYQFVETVKDPITWLFVVAIFLNMLENSTTYEASIVYKALGFSNLTTTLLMVVQTGFGVFCAIAGSIALRIFRRQSVYVACVCLFVAWLGGMLAVTIPYDNKPGILAGIFMTRPNGTAYIIIFSLCTTTAAGYTKKLTRTALFMVAYSIANFISPQLWQSEYAPRYIVSWSVQIVCSFTLCPLCLLVIRYILLRRNRQRLAAMESDDGDDYGYIDENGENGEIVRQKVDVSMLDLTDLENKKFIYPL